MMNLFDDESFFDIDLFGIDDTVSLNQTLKV